MLQNNKLYKRNYEGVYLKCLGCEEAKEVVEHFHDKYGIGHGSTKATAHMILRSGYFWPSIFKDTFEHIHSCHIYQTSANRERNLVMPLQLVYKVCLFKKWGFDSIGLVNPPSSTRHAFILTDMDYCTQWTKAKTFKNCTTKVVTDFLEEHIVTKFRIPFVLVCDNGFSFALAFLTQWAFENQVIIKFSSNYYPQGNGVVESTNKNLIIVIR